MSINNNFVLIPLLVFPSCPFCFPLFLMIFLVCVGEYCVVYYLGYRNHMNIQFPHRLISILLTIISVHWIYSQVHHNNTRHDLIHTARESKWTIFNDCVQSITQENRTFHDSLAQQCPDLNTRCEYYWGMSFKHFERLRMVSLSVLVWITPILWSSSTRNGKIEIWVSIFALAVMIMVSGVHPCVPAAKAVKDVRVGQVEQVIQQYSNQTSYLPRIWIATQLAYIFHSDPIRDGYICQLENSNVNSSLYILSKCQTPQFDSKSAFSFNWYTDTLSYKLIRNSEHNVNFKFAKDVIINTISTLIHASLFSIVIYKSNFLIQGYKTILSTGNSLYQYMKRITLHQITCGCRLRFGHPHLPQDT